MNFGAGNAGMDPHMMGVMEELQMKDMLKGYNKLVERCFDSCITSFRVQGPGEGLAEKEKKCVSNCFFKFFQFSQRVQMKFAEESQVDAEALAKQQQ